MSHWDNGSDKEKEIMQAFFDKACHGVLEQGCLAADYDGCYLRMPMGNKTLKCAIGFMVSDRQMERYGVSFDAPVGNMPEELIAEMLPGVDPFRAEQFMRDLQNAHDGMLHKKYTDDLFPVLFKERANHVAQTYGLKCLE